MSCVFIYENYLKKEEIGGFKWEGHVGPTCVRST